MTRVLHVVKGLFFSFGGKAWGLRGLCGWRKAFMRLSDRESDAFSGEGASGYEIERLRTLHWSASARAPSAGRNPAASSSVRIRAPRFSFSPCMRIGDEEAARTPRSFFFFFHFFSISATSFTLATTHIFDSYNLLFYSPKPSW